MDGFMAQLGQATGGMQCDGAHDGGLGGGATALNGGASADNGGTNGAGGGGSVGRIMFRSLANAVPTGAINPSMGAAHSMLMIR